MRQSTGFSPDLGTVTPLDNRRALLAASKLISLGFSVIWLRSPAQKQYWTPKGPFDLPVERRGKIPINEGWSSQDALQIEDLARMLGDGEPGYNLGIRTGLVQGASTNVIVVDFDSDEALAWGCEALPETKLKTQSSRGQHWFYRRPPASVRIGNKVRVGGMAFELKGDGGMVVGPSSVHGTGHVYRGVLPWTKEAVDSMPIFDPSWFGMTAEWEGVEDPVVRNGGERRPPVYQDSTFKRKRALAYLEHTPGTVSGQGTASNECLATARALVYGLCIPPEEAARLMHQSEWNLRCTNSTGEPYPWDHTELLHKCNDAYRLNFNKDYGFLLLEGPGQKNKKEEGDLSPAAREMQNYVREIQDQEKDSVNWDFAVEEQQVADPGRRRWPLTDTGNAERLTARFGESIRFVEDRRVWSAWDGASGRWVTRPVALDRCSKITARKIAEEFETADNVAQAAARAAEEADEDEKDEADERAEAAADALEKLQGWQKGSESKDRRKAMIDLSASEPGIAVGSDAFDRYPLLLNVRNGILDLSGTEPKIVPHNRDFYLTKTCMVAWDPKAEATTWLKCLSDWTGGNQNLMGYLQRVAGYTLTGSVEEEVFFIFYGIGQNGKSTFLNALASILGPYATAAPAGLLMETRQDKATPSQQAGLASLVGCRMVIASETDESACLSEAQVKAITSKDPIKAARKFEAPFDFVATHKGFLGTNPKPIVTGTDDGIWRRLQIMKWGQKISKMDRDNKLAEKLLAERPGILRWAVEGCAIWKAQGLDPPPEILAEIEEYRMEQDTLGRFIRQSMEIDPAGTVPKPQFREAYERWCEQNGAKPYGMKKLFQELERKGIKDDRNAQSRLWVGLKFKMGVQN